MVQTAGHADRTIDRELAALIADLSSMGDKILAQMSLICTAIQEPKTEYLVQVRALDKEINALEHQIEEEVMLFFSRHQPMLVELRFVTFSMKLVMILERMGDLAKNTVRRLNKLGEPLTAEAAQDLEKMTKATMEMLKRSLQMLSAFNKDVAKALVRRDDAIDALYKKQKKALKADLEQTPDRARFLNQQKQIAVNLERSGDYVADIARIVYFIHTGERLTKS